MVSSLLASCFLIVGASSTGAQISWKQASSDGFGDSNNTGIRSMAVFDGYLYAGTVNWTTGTEVWRTSDGETWGQVNTDGFGDDKNLEARSMAVFNGYLYVGTLHQDLWGELWRTQAVGGPPFTDWGEIDLPGAGMDLNNRGIYSMAVFNDYLYVGTYNNWGCEVWRSSDGVNWQQVNSDGFGDGNNTEARSMAAFDGYLYVGTYNVTTGGEVWRTAAVGGPPFTDWEQINTDGFDDSNNRGVLSMLPTPFELYVGTYNQDTGAQVHRWNGTEWSTVTNDGFGDANNVSVDSMVEFESARDFQDGMVMSSGIYYLGATAHFVGTKVWEMPNRKQWNDNGFGDANNTGADLMIIFENCLYVGTTNAGGAEVWKGSPVDIPELIPYTPDPTNDSTPTLDWHDVEGAVLYNIWIDNEPNFDLPLWVDVDYLTSSTFTPPEPLPDGRYYWNVSAGDNYGNWTGFASLNVDNFLIDTTPPSAPVLLSPEDGSVTQDNTPTFDWEDVTGDLSGIDHYTIEVDNNSDFSSPVINDTATSSTYVSSTELSDDNYWWRVRATDAAGNEGEWSETRAFEITSVGPPGAPVLYLPENQDQLADNTPYFEWTVGSGATYHRLQIDDDADFLTPIYDNANLGGSENSISVENELLPDNYWWRVAAGNAQGETWSTETQAFELFLQVIVGAPILMSPSNGLVISDLTPLFEWSSVEGAESYRLQIDDDSNFSSPVYDVFNLVANTHELPAENALTDGVWYWRVLASGGEWSQTWSFTVSTLAPLGVSPGIWLLVAIIVIIVIIGALVVLVRKKR